METLGRDLDVLLYGATGYSGALIARELDEAKARFAVAGRDQGRLDQIAGTFATEPEAVALSLEDAEGLRDAAARARCVLSAAGPYGALGPPVVEACLETGTHFGDITGEQTYLRWCADQDDRARDANIIIANALGFDVVPSDLALTAACEGLDEVERLDLGIHVDRMPPSRGTRRTMANMASEGVWYDRGRYRSASAGRFRRAFTFPEPIGRRTGVFIPWGDVATAPRSTNARSVRTFFTLPARQARLMHWMWPVTHVLSKTGRVGKRLSDKADRSPPGPDPEARAKVRFTMLAEASASDARQQRAVATGRDPYGLTGAAAAFAAQRIASGEVDARGVLTPSQVLDRASWEKALAGFDLYVDGPEAV